MFNNLTIKKASQMLKEKKISSLELTKFYLDRIRKYDKEIRGFINVDEDATLKQAEDSDGRRQTGHLNGDLDGVSVAIKDVIVTKDFPTTAGSKILENYRSPYDSTVVRKLRQAGMIFTGKTNLDEFAMGSSTENSSYFITKNPWDTSRVPGGSSGGSAAAIAADMTTAALGSDTGGSIRQPAGLCGIVGLKPTYGSVSRYGLIAMASSLDQIGPMTKTTEDASLIFKAIKGHDDNDATLASENYVAKMSQKCRKNVGPNEIVIGIPKEYFIAGLDKEVENGIEQAIRLLAHIGFKMKEVSLPHTQYALSVYYILMPVEVASNLARYDGIRFGLSSETLRNLKTEKLKNFIDEIKEIRASGFGPEVKRRIILGTFASSVGYAEKYYLQAQKVRSLIKMDFDQAFRTVDAIVAPVSPSIAFKIGEKVNDPLSMYLSDIFTIPVNLAGLPAMSMPCGLVNNALAVSSSESGLSSSSPLRHSVSEASDGSGLTRSTVPPRRSSGTMLARSPRVSSAGWQLAQKESGKKLPVGIQIITPHFCEDLIFKIGMVFEKETCYKFRSPLP